MGVGCLKIATFFLVFFTRMFGGRFKTNDNWIPEKTKRRISTVSRVYESRDYWRNGLARTQNNCRSLFEQNLLKINKIIRSRFLLNQPLVWSTISSFFILFNWYFFMLVIHTDYKNYLLIFFKRICFNVKAEICWE